MNAQTHLIDRWISYIMYDDLLICLYVVVHGRWGNVVITTWTEWGNSSEQKTNMYNSRFDWLHFRLNTRIMTTKTLTRYPSTCFIVQFLFFSCLNGLYTICIRHTTEQYQSIVLQRIVFQYLNALAEATFGSYTFVSFTW